MMINESKVSRIAILLSTLSMLFYSACAGPPALPDPESASGVYLQAGFEYYRWEDGLRLMIWIDGIKTSGCNTSTDGRSYELSCYAINKDDIRFDWHMMTSDGINAEFSIDHTAYDLDENNVFILSSSDGEMHIRQLKRDLSGLPAEAGSVTEFGLVDPDIRELLQVSPEIADCISSAIVPVGSPDASRLATAKEVLRTFFKHLHDGEYGRAAVYYGGEYDVMRSQNPGIAPDDYTALFRNACTVNGAQCLRIRQVTVLEQPSPAEFRFAVQFSNEDGSLFRRGPCCGDDRPEMGQQDEFIYSVQKECTGRYLVLEMPVYLP